MSRSQGPLGEPTVQPNDPGIASTKTTQLNPSAGHFRPSGSHQTPGSQAKFEKLGYGQIDLRAEIEGLKTWCESLQATVDTYEKGTKDVVVGQIQDQKAIENKKKLDALSAEVIAETGGAGDGKDTSAAPSVVSSTPNGVPPHLRPKAGSLPPHLRKGASTVTEKSTSSDESATNKSGSANGVANKLTIASATQTYGPTPPASPSFKHDTDLSVSSVTSITLSPTATENWKPHYIITLPALASSILDRIPPPDKMTTFHADFLCNTFGGFSWSLGFNFVPIRHGHCMLANRSYYTLEERFEPFLPSRPGEHGAKLVPFFNEPPEYHHPVPNDFPSTADNVPLFVMRKDANGHLRYTYFGHYSQTRWSDKLDYDRMLQCIPTSLRAYWAEELSSVGRPEWLSEALRKHFFPKPEYPGRLFGVPVGDSGSVESENAGAIKEKVRKDVNKYVEALKQWDKVSRTNMVMIDKEAILQAFNTADADEPPALRLWWEYLECVDWKADFYELLVTLQSRDPNYERY